MCRFFLFECVIGRPYQRSRFHVFESHRLAQPLELREFVGMHVTLDRQMLVRRLHVLAERQNVRALRRDIFHGRQHFFARFAQAQHHSGFCGQSRNHFSRAPQ